MALAMSCFVGFQAAFKTGIETKCSGVLYSVMYLVGCHTVIREESESNDCTTHEAIEYVPKCVV